MRTVASWSLPRVRLQNLTRQISVPEDFQGLILNKVSSEARSARPGYGMTARRDNLACGSSQRLSWTPYRY